MVDDIFNRPKSKKNTEHELFGGSRVKEEQGDKTDFIGGLFGSAEKKPKDLPKPIVAKPVIKPIDSSVPESVMMDEPSVIAQAMKPKLPQEPKINKAQVFQEPPVFQEPDPVQPIQVQSVPQQPIPDQQGKQNILQQFLGMSKEDRATLIKFGFVAIIMLYILKMVIFG